MKFFKVLFLSGIFFFTLTLNAQEKEKNKSVKYVKVEKSKLSILKQNPNYKIVAKKDIKEKLPVRKKKKSLNVIEALKQEFKK